MASLKCIIPVHCLTKKGKIMKKTRMYCIGSSDTIGMRYGVLRGVVFHCPDRSFVVGKNAFASKAKAEVEIMRRVACREALKPRKAASLPVKAYFHIAESILVCARRIQRKAIVVKQSRSAADMAQRRLIRASLADYR